MVCENVTMRNNIVTMTNKELKRVNVIGLAVSGTLTNLEASKLLNVCIRQIIRLKNKFINNGAGALIHGNAGKTPKNALSNAIKCGVIRLFNEFYYDHNFSHFTERLKERENIVISRSSVSRILRSEGIKSKRAGKKRKSPHTPRPRKNAFGIMWQTDASKHKWFGDQHEYVTLHAYIDDATNIVTGAFFTANECAFGYRKALEQGLLAYGVPLSIYSDRHSIFTARKDLTIQEELEGATKPLSTFGKALKELGIEQITALSPEAKGRIERLWNTMQDRLTAELRLKGIVDIDKANDMLKTFIEEFNRKFSVKPKKTELASLAFDKKTNLNLVFALRTERKAGKGNTISYNGSLYIPDSKKQIYFRQTETLEVRETIQQEVYVIRNDEAILMKALEKIEKMRVLQKQHAETNINKTTLSNNWKPSANHPWRKFSLKKNLAKNTNTNEKEKVTFSLNK